MDAGPIIYTNGLTCLRCGKGWYEGYAEDGTKTVPCQECGHQAPAMMIWQEVIDAREALTRPT